MAAIAQSNVPQFIPRMLHYMGQMCEEHYAVKEQLDDPQLDQESARVLVRKGIWYPLDYCQTLRRFGYQKRLQSIINNGTAYCGYMPKEAFVPIPDKSGIPTKRKLYQYTIADDVAPSVALQKIHNSCTILDCYAVRDIAFYQSLEETIGSEKFNSLFDSNSRTPLIIGNSNQIIKRLCNKIEVPESTYLSPGDFCHFSNIQNYILKHPFGGARGFNVVCSEMVDIEEKPRFLGLGLPLGCYAEEIEHRLFTAYNADPIIPEDFFNKEIVFYNYNFMLPGNYELARQVSDSYKNLTLTQEQFEAEPCRKVHDKIKKERRLLLKIDRPDLAKIQKLVDAPLRSIHSVFRKLA